jgi:hypothetical protein
MKSRHAAFSQRSGADSGTLRRQIGPRGTPWNAARQMPGRPAFLPGTAMYSGRSGYRQNASIMPGNSFMFHYRPYCLRMVGDCRRIGNFLETSWKPRGLRSGIGNFLETSWKLPRSDGFGRQMADTPSILSAALTQRQSEENHDARSPLVRHLLYVPLPVFAAVWWRCWIPWLKLPETF